MKPLRERIYNRSFSCVSEKIRKKSIRGEAWIKIRQNALHEANDQVEVAVLDPIIDQVLSLF